MGRSIPFHILTVVVSVLTQYAGQLSSMRAPFIQQCISMASEDDA